MQVKGRHLRTGAEGADSLGCRGLVYTWSMSVSVSLSVCVCVCVCVCVLRASRCFLRRSRLSLWLSPAAVAHVNGGVAIRELGRTWLSLAALTGLMK